MKPAFSSAGDRAARFPVNPRARFLAVLSCAAIVGSTFLACKKKHAPLRLTPNPKTAVARNYRLTIEGAEECETDARWLKPARGNILFGIDMTIEGTSNESVGVYAHEFKATDLKGKTYTTSVLLRCKPELDAIDSVKKNEKLRGIVTFEVPESTSGLKLYYGNNVGPGIGRDEINVELSR